MSEKHKKPTGLWKEYAGLSAITWIILLGAKAMGGYKGISWTAAWLGCIWIPAIMLVLLALMFALYVLAEIIKRAIRLRKVRKRIRDLAVKLEVWGQPLILAGIALDLYAWEIHRMKRRKLETDQEFRKRIIAKTEEKKKKIEGEPVQTPPKGSETDE